MWWSSLSPLDLPLLNTSYLCLIKTSVNTANKILVDSFCPFQQTGSYSCHHVHSFLRIHNERWRGEAIAGEPVLATSLWGMLYADDAGSSEQLRKMMGVVVVVYAAFRLTVSEAKTEIMCLRAKGVPESTTIFSVEVAGQV